MSENPIACHDSQILQVTSDGQSMSISSTQQTRQHGWLGVVAHSPIPVATCFHYILAQPRQPGIVQLMSNHKMLISQEQQLKHAVKTIGLNSK